VRANSALTASEKNLRYRGRDVPELWQAHEAPRARHCASQHPAIPASSRPAHTGAPSLSSARPSLLQEPRCPAQVRRARPTPSSRLLRPVGSYSSSANPRASSPSRAGALAVVRAGFAQPKNQACELPRHPRSEPPCAVFAGFAPARTDDPGQGREPKPVDVLLVWITCCLDYVSAARRFPGLGLE
jgi:hypothetical protein